MLEWAKKQLETVLGKSVVGLISVFALGAAVAWGLPNWVVTTEAFAQGVKQIYSDMDKGDKWQEMKVIELRKDIWVRQLYDLEDRIDTQGHLPTARQRNRMEEIKKEIEQLKQEETRLQEVLKQRP